MKKKYITLALAALILNLSFSASAFTGTTEENTKKVQASVAKLGKGTDARVEIKLKDGTKLKGFISSFDDQNFSVTVDKSGTVREIPYPAVKQIKGKNLSTGVTIAIVLGAIALIAILVYSFRNIDQ